MDMFDITCWLLNVAMWLFTTRIPALGFIFHLILRSYDYNVEGQLPANLCLVTILSPVLKIPPATCSNGKQIIQFQFSDFQWFAITEVTGDWPRVTLVEGWLYCRGVSCSVCCVAVFHLVLQPGTSWRCTASVPPMSPLPGQGAGSPRGRSTPPQGLHPQGHIFSSKGNVLHLQIYTHVLYNNTKLGFLCK